jgi:hypothetical protein
MKSHRPLVVALSVSATRLFLFGGTSSLGGSRYTHWIGVFVVVSFVPATFVTLASKMASPNGRIALTIGFSALLAAGFLVSTAQIQPVQDFERGWGANAERTVRQAAAILKRGCYPYGVDEHGNLASRFDPNLVVTVGTIKQVLDRGAYQPEPVRSIDPAVEEIICVQADPGRPAPSDT